MSDIVALRRRADSLETSPQFDSYSKVIINIDDKSYVSAGDDTGRTMEVYNPFGTQQMATDILARLQGYQYQPYTADGATLDPAAEIGDGVTIGNIYGGIYQRSQTFSRLMKADISAPEDKEINHEFRYVSSTERQFSREIGDVKATLLVQSNEISAKVSQENLNESFGWKLLSDSWSVYSNGSEVFRVDATGGTFTGKVVAAEGQIGGFTIGATAIYSNLNELDGTQTSGVYIGTNGIQLGQNFKVSSYGTVEASGIRLKGSIMFVDAEGNYLGSMSAANLRSGASSAYSWATNGTASNWTLGFNYGSLFKRMSQGDTVVPYVLGKTGKFENVEIHDGDLTVDRYVWFKNGGIYLGQGRTRYQPISVSINGTIYSLLGYRVN